jgi:flavin-dependent dehydrogenase
VAEASELGPLYQVRVPSYQLDRATFDEEVLRRAAAAGAHVARPATITGVQLCSGNEQTVTYRGGDETKTVRSRWIVDASDVAAILAQKEGWWKSNTEHPTAAAWSRWKGVKDWDSRELAEKYPQWSRAIYAMRNTATNHVIGDGWWSWWIPLKDGDVSVRRCSRSTTRQLAAGRRQGWRTIENFFDETSGRTRDSGRRGVR